MSKSQVDKNIRRVKGKVYGILFIFCILLIILFMFNSKMFLISKVSILNNINLADEEILALSGIEVSDNIFRIRLSEVREKMIEHPRIKDVEISRSLPNKITFNVSERTEFLAVKYIGINFIIDSEGYIIESLKENPGLYEVTGVEVTGYKDGTKLESLNEDALNAIIKLCKYVDLTELGFIPRFELKNDDIFMYINENFVVKFGDGTNIEDRFNKFHAIYLDLKMRTINSGVVNVNHNGYPSYIPYDE